MVMCEHKCCIFMDTCVGVGERVMHGGVCVMLRHTDENDTYHRLINDVLNAEVSSSIVKNLNATSETSHTVTQTY